MSDETMPGFDQPGDPAVPAMVALPWMALCQAPLMIGAAWWNAMIDLTWPVPRIDRHPAHPDPHAQLVVPEPIEACGERSLLA